MFAALGRSVFRHRWLVLVVWSALFLLGIAAIPFLGDTLKGGGFDNPSSPSQRAATLIKERLGTGFTMVEVVFTSPNLQATDKRFQAAQEKAMGKLHPGSLPGLVEIHTYASTGQTAFVSRDGRTSVAVLVFAADEQRVQRLTERIRQSLQPTALTAYVTGSPAVNADIVRLSLRDLRVAESYAIPIALLALLLVFGTVAAAMLPVVAGGMAVTVTLGILFVLGQVADVSIFAMNVASLLGLAVGIDYALFMVARFREELAAGASVAEAVEITVGHAGRSVFFSGLAVAIGILGLVFFPFSALRSIGIAGALVVAVSVLAAITVLPALLATLGGRVNSWRILRVPTGTSRFWGWWSRWVLRWPVAALAISLLVIGAFAAPVLRMTTQMPTAAVLPSEAESRQGYEVLTREFDMGELTPINVALSWDGAPDPLTASRLPALANFGRLLASQQDVRSVTSVANLPHVDSPLALVFFWQAVKPALETGEAVRIGSREISAEQIAGLQQLAKATTAPGIVVYRVAPKADPSSATASDLVERLRRLTPPDGMTLSIAGESAARLDFYDGLTGRFPWVAASIIIATFVILVLLTHSLVVPLKAIVVNTFTILMAWGTIVYIFQDGHFERVLRFTSSGAVDAIMPIIIFCTLYGVSMDYEVFLLARMHECWRRTHNSHQSVAAGLTCSGRVIVSAAALVVVVAGSFAFTSISMTKTLGIGIAFAIALDALFVRMMLVPAIMRLAGRWSWWLPGRLNHRLPDLGEE